MSVEDTPERLRERFPPTRWTLVQNLQDGGAPAEKALGELCEIYWFPVYSFLRRDGVACDDAQDLTQGFFLRLLTKDFLARADSEKGKLRTFLLGALKRFRIDDYRAANRLKRGRGKVAIPLDAEEWFCEEPAGSENPEVLFERRWALSLLDEAFARTEKEYDDSGKADLFGVISAELSGRETASPGYAKLGERLGMSVGAVQVAVHRLRKRYRRQLEAVVCETLTDPGQLEEELRHVFTIMTN